MGENIKAEIEVMDDSQVFPLQPPLSDGPLDEEPISPTPLWLPSRQNSVLLDAASLAAIQDIVNKAIEKDRETTKSIMLRLVKEVNGLRRDVAELRKIPLSQNTCVISKSILPKSPFNKLEDFMSFEKTIESDENKYNQLKLDLRLLCTNNGKQCVKIMWRKIMTDEVAKKFSWRGTEDKLCIRNLSVTQAIKNLFIHEINGTEDVFVDATKQFFQFANNRIKNRQQSK